MPKQLPMTILTGEWLGDRGSELAHAFLQNQRMHINMQAQKEVPIRIDYQDHEL